MTASEFNAAVEYWQGVLQPLGLSHFRFETNFTNDDDDTWATAEVSKHYDSVTFHVQEDLLREDEQKIDETIIHEWLHVLFRDLDRITEDPVLYTVLAGPFHKAYLDGVYHEREGIVDRMSRLIYALHSDVVG